MGVFRRFHKDCRLQFLRIDFCLTTRWKALNQDDYCLKTIFEKVPERGIGTRLSNQIRLKTSLKSRLRENSFQYPSVQLWNASPPEITEASSEPKARAAIRKHVKESIPIWIKTSHSRKSFFSPQYLSTIKSRIIRLTDKLNTHTHTLLVDPPSPRCVRT